MLLICRMLFVVVAMIGVMHNAVADCVQHKQSGELLISLKNNHGLSKTMTADQCRKYTNVVMQYPDVVSYRLVCAHDKFVCIPHECPPNTKLNKNGFCVGNPTDQQRWHENVPSYHPNKSLWVFDACTSFKPNDQSGVVKEAFINDRAHKIKYACITDFYDKNVSIPMAIELIKFNYWDNIGMIKPEDCTIKQNFRYKSGRGRSIRCRADDVYVEFIFGMLDYQLKTSIEDVAAKLCPMFGYEQYDVLGNYHRCMKNGDTARADTKKSYAGKQLSSEKFRVFLRDAEWMDFVKLDGNAYEILPLRRDIDFNKQDSLSPILDTDIFQNVRANATGSVRAMIREYIERQLKSAGYTIQDIIFYSARSDHNYTADHSIWPVNIQACPPNGDQCYSYKKIFKFRSLFGDAGKIHFKTLVDLDAEMMSCLILDGLFDSKHCFFLEEDINKEKRLCETGINGLIKDIFGTNNSAQAYFDNSDQMCVLKQSNKNAKVLQTLSVATQIGFLVVATVATAGAGSVLSFVVAGAGLVADGIALGAEIKMNKASAKFLKLSTRCYDANCAKKYFEEEFAHMLRLMDVINDDEFRVIDNEMNRLVQLLDDSYITKLSELKDETTGFFASMSTEKAVLNVATVVSMALSMYDLFKGSIKILAAKSKNINPKFTKTLGARMDKAIGKNLMTPKQAYKVDKTMKKTKQVALANKVDYNQLSDVDKEWYNLWKQYAPKNQTFAEFKAITNGNLDEMTQMAGNWAKIRDKMPAVTKEIEKQVKDAEEDLKNKIAVWDNLLEKYTGYTDFRPDENEIARLGKQYPDFGEATKEVNIAQSKHKHLKDANSFLKNTPENYYSTFDPEMSAVFSKYNKKRLEIDKEVNSWYDFEFNKRSKSFYESGKTGAFIGSDEYKQLTTEYFAFKHQRELELEKLKPTQWTIADDFHLKNLANVTEERVRVMNDVIESNPNIKSKLTVRVWLGLNSEERLDVVRQLMDEYATKLGAPKPEMFLDPKLSLSADGYYQPGTNRIGLNPKFSFKIGGNALKNTLAHEYGHLVDDQMPNMGALGEQYSYQLTPIYTSEKSEGYFVALTEQSSFTIGSATVGKSVPKQMTTVAAVATDIGLIGVAIWAVVDRYGSDTDVIVVVKKLKSSNEDENEEEHAESE